MNHVIFFDHNSTTPLLREAYEAMSPYFYDQFYNPGNTSQIPLENINRAAENARETISNLINGSDGKIIFTSSASEANNTAIKQKKYELIITSPIEHPSVLNPVNYRQNNGTEIFFLKIDDFGRIDIDNLENLLKSAENKKKLVTIQYVNQVIHTIQPVMQISSLCQKYNADYHIDAAQAFGRINLDLNELKADMITISAHKCYGPKGIGALWIRNRILNNDFESFIHGGHQEYGYRAGSLNIPGIIGFSKACEIVLSNLDERNKKVHEITNHLYLNLSKAVNDIKLNGHPENRISGGLHFSIYGVDMRSIITSIPDIIVSTGMACNGYDTDPVLGALNRSSESRFSMRLQLGFENTIEEVNYFIDVISKKIAHSRKFWGDL